MDIINKQLALQSDPKQMAAVLNNEDPLHSALVEQISAVNRAGMLTITGQPPDWDGIYLTIPNIGGYVPTELVIRLGKLVEAFNLQNREFQISMDCDDKTWGYANPHWDDTTHWMTLMDERVIDDYFAAMQPLYGKPPPIWSRGSTRKTNLLQDYFRDKYENPEKYSKKGPCPELTPVSDNDPRQLTFGGVTMTPWPDVYRISQDDVLENYLDTIDDIEELDSKFRLVSFTCGEYNHLPPPGYLEDCVVEFLNIAKK